MRLEELFCARLRLARKRAGLSQQALGVMLDLDETTAISRISHYERGIYQPNLQTIQRLAKALGVPPSWFFATPEEAELLLQLSRLSKSRRTQMIDRLIDQLDDGK